MTSSAALQNNIRQRVVLVVALSLGIQMGRPFVSESVHKATMLIELNYALYGMLLLCSVMPSKTVWYVGALVSVLATFLDAAVLGLGMVATMRCIDKAGCVATIPGSVLVLGLVGLQCGLDAYQTWNVYIVLRRPRFVASSSQRLRVTVAWALPFTFLTNLVLMAQSAWTVWVSPGLVAYPVVIVVAQSREDLFVAILLGVALGSQLIALLTVEDTLARTSLVIQSVLSTMGLLLTLVPTTMYVKPPPRPDPEVVPVLPVNSKSTPFRSTENELTQRRNKSRHLHF
tara:strand:- start:10436 stop:11293 length:858 start_codon:yes stop_codon:yes gene_type:complete